ncbi:MAG: SH3 domain-containing protein [Endomicrobia bacterium]|nr:SH3 domain-containing protein [Endomicrobiia bacterium]
MKKIFFFALIAFCIAGCGGPRDSYNDRLSLAESSFKAGDYAKAAAAYENIVNVEGVKNPYIYYNLSNACYRSGQMGKAVLNIERAWRLAPRDSDIRHNRNFLRNLAGQSHASFFAAASNAILGVCSLNEAAAAVLLLFAGFCILMSLYFLLRKKAFKAAAITAAVLFIPAAALSGFKIYSEMLVTKAVFIEEGAVRSGPGDINAELFTAGEGRVVRVLSQSGDWSSIQSDEGGASQYGWAESSKLEKI